MVDFEKKTHEFEMSVFVEFFRNGIHFRDHRQKLENMLLDACLNKTIEPNETH